MSKKQKRILWPLFVVIALAMSTLAFVSTRKALGSRATATQPPTSRAPRALAGAGQINYVHRSLLRPLLTANLMALGDRLEKPGKERLTITGTLTRSGGASPNQVVAISEYPDQLNLTLQKGAQTRIISFDGQHAAAAVGAPPDAEELDLVETLVYDTAEHFFATQMQGAATRFLGSRFRMDDGSAPKYTGPYYDIYEVSDQIKAAADLRQQGKHYYFNADTLLPEHVHYQLNRGGSTIKVESLIGDWQKGQGQQIPRRIERLENNGSVFVLVVHSVTLGPHVADGIFGNTAR